MNIYDLPKEKQDELESIGVDGDLSSCLYFNAQRFDILDIKRAVYVKPDGNI